MSTDRDLTRITRWLEESRSALPPSDPGHVLPLILERLATTPQRHATRLGIPRAGGYRPWARAAAIGSMVVLLAMAVALFVAGSAPPAPTERPRGLVYVLDGDIVVAGRDGTEPVRILHGSEAPCGVFELPVVSPDGRHIAYRSTWGDGCPGAITIIDLDGNVISAVPGVGWDISWSPDGTRVATWLTISVDGQVGIYGIDGVLQTVLDGSHVCCGDHDPVWSPDGSASILIRGRDDLGSSGSQMVQELPLDGSPRRIVPADDPRSRFYSDRNITAVVSAGEPVRYSPDRTQAAFVDPSGLVVVDRDGTQQRVLVPGGIAEGPEWSPTGDRIAFLDGSGSRLSVVDVATGTVTMLADGRSTRDMGFSPEGDRILFAQSDANDVSSLWSVNTDGSGVERLVDGADWGAWLPVPSDATPSSAP